MLHFITKINKKTEHPPPPKIPTPYRTVSRVTAHPVNFISVLGSYCLQNLSRFQFSHFPLSGNSDEITFLPEAFRGIQESCLPLQEMYFSGIFSFFFSSQAVVICSLPVSTTPSDFHRRPVSENEHLPILFPSYPPFSPESRDKVGRKAGRVPSLQSLLSKRLTSFPLSGRRSIWDQIFVKLGSKNCT